MSHREPRPSRATGRGDGVPPARAVDASMGLLNDVMYRPVRLGPSRPSSGGGGSDKDGGRRRMVTAVLSGLLGLLTVTAILSLRAPAAAVDEGRALLVEEITDRTAERDDLETTSRQLSDEIAELQERLLRVSDPTLVAELRRLELLAGAVPVGGPGLVVELDDGAVLEQGAADPESRVQDVDLKMVVNALWAAGAEAMAVNGERLTSLTTVRTAGETIWVNFVPLTAPYRVEAVGDPATMQTRFARSSAAATLVSLESTYGITATVSTAEELDLPAGSARGLRYATTTVDVTSSTETPAQEGAS
ncbi:DUF881 domain-containing protein [Actinotalea sp. Marseille-Q4924]|uniref:DUF881 domain-containing protein n=1 Tax=Actinotalea sp. Marseille-Q4924 TaxID=2866571 RepID=UPI001CE49861|nr:DUF881 domain-containing protein [Actinotalea sp. Marseille-Q4924]